MVAEKKPNCQRSLGECYGGADTNIQDIEPDARFIERALAILNVKDSLERSSVRISIKNWWSELKT